MFHVLSLANTSRIILIFGCHCAWAIEIAFMILLNLVNRRMPFEFTVIKRHNLFILVGSKRGSKPLSLSFSRNVKTSSHIPISEFAAAEKFTDKALASLDCANSLAASRRLSRISFTLLAWSESCTRLIGNYSITPNARSVRNKTLRLAVSFIAFRAGRRD